MSLIIKDALSGDDLSFKTFPYFDESKGESEVRILIEGNEISAEDMNAVIRYYMTNTDLVDGDPRYYLKDFISSLKEVEGFNKGATRFETSD